MASRWPVVDGGLPYGYPDEMASNSDSAALGKGLLLGFLGGAFVGAVTGNAAKPSPEAQFEVRLRAALLKSGFQLASLHLGHSATGPVWVVTVRYPDSSIITVHAPANGAPALDLALADDIGARITNALRAVP